MRTIVYVVVFYLLGSLCSLTTGRVTDPIVSPSQKTSSVQVTQLLDDAYQAYLNTSPISASMGTSGVRRVGVRFI